MTDTYESRSRLFLRAYPPRYRAAREAELLGTLLDAAPPGATRPSMRDSWDIVRGGLTTRLLDRPPVHHWLAYRLFGKRVPHQYRMWVRDDALGRFLFLRRNIGFYLFVVLFWVQMRLSTPGASPIPPAGTQRWIFIATFVLVSLNPLFVRPFRTRILHKHEFAADGTERTAGGPPRGPDRH